MNAKVEVTNGRKVCPSCKESLPVSEFCRSSALRCGYSSYCRGCDRERKRKSREANPVSTEKMREYKRRHAEKVGREAINLRDKKSLFKRTYGISWEERIQMAVDQEYRCAICRKMQSDSGLVMDHNHQTGDNRKLLCNPCNMALGGFRDDIEILRRAVEYLEQHQGGEK